jgi:hypothetical protein
MVKEWLDSLRPTETFCDVGGQLDAWQKGDQPWTDMGEGEEGGCEGMVWRETDFSEVSMLQGQMMKLITQSKMSTPSIFKVHNALILALEDPKSVRRWLHERLDATLEGWVESDSSEEESDSGAESDSSESEGEGGEMESEESEEGEEMGGETVEEVVEEEEVVVNDVYWGPEEIWDNVIWEPEVEDIVWESEGEGSDN